MAGREGGKSSMEPQFLVQEECSSMAGGGIEVTESPELFPGNIRDSDRRGGHQQQDSQRRHHAFE